MYGEIAAVFKEASVYLRQFSPVCGPSPLVLKMPTSSNAAFKWYDPFRETNPILIIHVNEIPTLSLSSCHYMVSQSPFSFPDKQILSAPYKPRFLCYAGSSLR